MPDPQLLSDYDLARKRKKNAEQELKECNAEFAQAERELLDAMADEGLQSMGNDRFTVSTSRTLRVQASGDKAAAAEQLSQRPGFADFVKRDFNLNSLSAHVRELAADKPDVDPNDLLPPEVREHLSVFEHYRLNFRSK
jgi:hypothetical protein